MLEVTLKAIEELLDLKLDEKFDIKLAPVKKTLENHTVLLDNIAKDVKTLMDEKTISNNRLDRLEDWGQKVGTKLDIKLEV